MAGTYSRTKKSMRNSVVALTIQFMAMLAGFFSRKIFIDCLGTEVLGLNTTAMSILNCLNVIELGIWSAISVTLYKPLYEGNRQAVKEIVALQGWLYRIVASLVIAGSLVVMCFFPQIFSKSELSLWYAYATFGVLLYSSILTYFVNYKRNALYADQQNYKVLMCSRLVALVKLICQAAAVRYSDHGYVWWLVLELVFATLGALITQMVVYKAFPYLKEPVANPSRLRDKYPEVLKKIKLLAFHKFFSFMTGQTGPIIIYAFASLSMVALYGNYLILTTNLSAVLAALYAGMEASVGNMVAEGDKKLTMKVFGELFCSRFLIVAVSTLCLWILADPFISVWLGEEYVMSKTTLALIIAGFFVGNTRSIVGTFTDAYGMFSDIWAPGVEAVLNVGLSVLGGYLYGLNGILGGALVSQLVIGFLWKPYFLFRWGLHEPVMIYVKMYAKYLLISVIAAAAVLGLSRLIHIDPSSSLLSFLEYAVLIFVASLGIMGGIAYLTDNSARTFTGRILAVVRGKK
ncbi:MAG: lipopolysaccharide biosynthesis protein [Candidatus Cryptobacteroides sp.]